MLILVCRAQRPLLMDDVTSMSLVGGRMAIARSLTHSLTHSLTDSLTHWLTHSKLINLFIKLELSNFLLPPLLCIVFVQECSVVLRKVWRGETRKAYNFVESLGKSWSSASKIVVGHYGFHVVLFRKSVVFWLSAFAHTSMKAGRSIYDHDDVSFTIARPARSKNWYQKARKLQL